MYRENDELSLKMKILVGLVFAPPSLVLHYFEDLSGNIPANPYYFQDHYLGRPARHGQRQAPNFAIEMWSMD